MRQEVYVENMTCDGCANTVKERFEGIPNVTGVNMDRENKKAILETTETISDAILAQVLEGTNYKINK